MILLVDNYDSFSYNLYQLIGSIEPDIRVIRNDELTVAEIEELTGKTYSRIHVVGGGCQDKFLNALIATETGKEVYAGPIEAPAIGNIMAQMLKDKCFADLPEARQVVAKSFDVTMVEGKLSF